VHAPPMLVADAGPLEESSSSPEVAVSEWAICARVSGRVHCSDGAKEPLTGAPPLAGIEDAVSVALGAQFGCVLTRRGKVLCFGSNAQGQLGAGLTDAASESPVEVRGLSDVKRISVGRTHACAQDGAGALFCWGENETGATGSDTAYTSEVRQLVVPTPVRVPPVVSVAAGQHATCAVTKEHEVYCWGLNVLPEQMKGPTENKKPARASSLSGAFTEVVAADDAFCAVRGQEHLCWGTSYSLFTESRGTTSAPAPLALPAVRRIALASMHGCALAADGTVRCFGSNWSGALGRDTGDDNTSTQGPDVVVGLPRARDIVVGGAMSCAVVDGGDVYCWGTWPLAARRTEGKPVKLLL
jgi:alpha-tubulin suppressor-like RCC1 family protein